MKRLRWTTLFIVCLLSACVRTSDGHPVADETAPATPSAPPTTTTQSTEAGEDTSPGVVETSRAPLPLQAVTCAPPIRAAVTFTAEVSDPKAPKITVAVPDGWTPSTGNGDVGAHLAGPAGMSATVTIAATEREPAAVFTAYADEIIEKAAVSSVSVLPDPLCEYSGQKLMGAWSDTPQNAVEFVDRIVHVWTNTTSYFVAVHVQAPTGTAGFDPASSLLTEDFGVRIP